MQLQNTRLVVNVDPALHKALKMTAAERDTTIKELVVSAVKKHLSNVPAGVPAEVNKEVLL